MSLPTYTVPFPTPPRCEPFFPQWTDYFESNFQMTIDVQEIIRHQLWNKAFEITMGQEEIAVNC